MKKLQSLLFVALIATAGFLSSCASYQPFTNEDRLKYNLDEAKLKKLQYYISTDVTLQRGERSNQAQELDKDGKLIISSSASLDNILITGKTPGVCVKVIDDNKIAVSFDASDDNKYLVFGDPNNRGRYLLMGAEWENGKGKINYGDKVFYVMPGGAGAYLKFQLQNVKKYKESSTKVKGRKVN
ncbi:MAG: hypothetical protein HYU68_09835 [Bacteroidetes bacterium]|nr:hypothetical protein [Bacteroidota bacterium]